MSEDGTDNEVRSSYDMGWDDAVIAIGNGIKAPIRWSLMTIPNIIEEEGNPEKYREGYRDAYHMYADKD